jgi:hypothetical protein
MTIERAGGWRGLATYVTSAVEGDNGRTLLRALQSGEPLDYSRLVVR